MKVRATPFIEPSSANKSTSENSRSPQLSAYSLTAGATGTAATAGALTAGGLVEPDASLAGVPDSGWEHAASESK